MILLFTYRCSCEPFDDSQVFERKHSFCVGSFFGSGLTLPDSRNHTTGKDFEALKLVHGEVRDKDGYSEIDVLLDGLDSLPQLFRALRGSRKRDAIGGVFFPKPSCS